MAVTRVNLETGTPGSTITTASGLGFVVGSPTFDSTRSAHGTQSARLPAGSVQRQLGFNANGLPALVDAFSFYIYMTALPAATHTMSRIDRQGSSTGIARVNIGTDGKMSFQTYDGTSWATRLTAAAAIPLNQWVRIEYRLEVDASAGVAQFAYYSGDSTTPIEGGTYSGINLGAVPIGTFMCGNYGSDNLTTDRWIDDPSHEVGRTSLIGPIANAAPVVTGESPKSVAAGASVPLSFTATDADGTIASRATSFDFPTSGAPAITGGTTATPSFTAGSAGSLYLIKQTATDDGGATGSAVTEVRVPVAGGTTLTPLPASGTGAAWANTGGAANDGTALGDGSDTTYLESPEVSGTETARRVRWRPSAARSTAQIVTKLGTDTGTANVTVRLYEGNSLRQSWTHALTTTPTTFTDTLSAGTIAAISDWGNLYVEVGATS